MRLNVKFFAVLKDKVGRSEEHIDSSATTPMDVYLELDARYHFHMHIESIRVAINDEFCDWNGTLKENDVLVFITPVAGG